MLFSYRRFRDLKVACLLVKRSVARPFFSPFLLRVQIMSRTSYRVSSSGRKGRGLKEQDHQGSTSQKVLTHDRSLSWKPILWVFLLILSVVLTPARHAWGAAYNAAGDFSVTQSSTSTWQYGYTSSPTSNTFVPYGVYNANAYPNIEGWASTSPGTAPPLVLHNNSTGTQTYSGITQPPTMLNLHPGPNGEKSVVRWRSPFAGTIKLQGRFQGLGSGSGASTDVTIKWSGAAQPLFQSYVGIANQTQKTPYSVTVTVAPGDTIDFMVGYGDGYYYNDSTGLDATIFGSDAVADFSATQNPSGPWRYGYYSPSSAYTFVNYTSHITSPPPSIETWAYSGISAPFVYRNPLSDPQLYDSVVHPHDLLNVHPGNADGMKSVVRWQAPATGWFKIEGRFQGISQSGTTTDVSIRVGTDAPWTSSISSYGAQVPFSQLVPNGQVVYITAGTAVDFAVGYGSNGNYYNDSTGLAATITPAAPPASQPQPGTASFTMGALNPWARTLDASTGRAIATATRPRVDLREVRGAVTYASLIVTNTGTIPLDVTVGDTLTLQDSAGHGLTADVRAIGNVKSSGATVPGPMFAKKDLLEINRELSLPGVNSNPATLSQPDILPYVQSVPAAVQNWAAIKDFPKLHLPAGQQAVVWITIETGKTEWFTDKRTYTGNVVANSVASDGSGQGVGSAMVPVSLVIEGRTSLFESALHDTMVWTSPILRKQADSGDPSGYSLNASKAAFYSDLLAHGGRTYFGWNPEAVNYGFRRVVLDSYNFWLQVTTGNDPATGKPWSHAGDDGHGNRWARWISPQEAADWAAGREVTYADGRHYLNADPTEFDRAVGQWAQTQACWDANAWQPYSYDKWMAQIWDEPSDSFADLHQRVAHQIHVYNGAVRIMANPFPADGVNGGITVAGLQKLNPDVTEWWPHTGLLYSGALTYLRSTGKPINQYQNLNSDTASSEDGALVYRHLGWLVPNFGLSGKGFWSASAISGDPWSGSWDNVLLVYPGPFGPLPSRNWEAFRRGGEDAWMIQILRWRSLSDAAKTELNQRVDAGCNGATGPGANGESDTLEQNHAWVVDMLSPPNS